jgi:molybdopterin converting factor small subunit
MSEYMNTITITVKLFGPLRDKMESDRKVMIEENEPIRSVIAKLSIEPQPWYLYSVNGQHARAETALHNGDILMIIPPISGG